MLLHEYSVYKIWESNQRILERENLILARAFENENPAGVRKEVGWQVFALLLYAIYQPK